MPLLLTAHPINQADRRLLLRVGQEARVGSSEWVELCISDDDAIASEHFVVRCGGDAVVEVLDDQQTLLVNGDSIRQFKLTSHCSQTTDFIAGQTAFSVSWFPDLVEPVAQAADHARHLTRPIIDDRVPILAVAKSMKLSEAALGLVGTPERIAMYLQRLIDAGLGDDAIRLIAGTLPATDAVNWAIDCSAMNPPVKSPVMDAVASWVATGAEVDRCFVRDQLIAARPSNVTKWIAKAVVFSGGSIAPEGQPTIPPPKHLCGIAILTAHRWALAAADDRVATVNHWVESGKLAIERTHTPDADLTTTGAG